MRLGEPGRLGQTACNSRFEHADVLTGSWLAAHDSPVWDPAGAYGFCIPAPDRRESVRRYRNTGNFIFAATGARHDEGPFDDLACDRRAQRAGRTRSSVAHPRDGADQFRQRRFALPAQPELERLPRTAVVSVRHGIPALLGIHAATQRAHPHRRRVVPAVSPRAHLDRHLRHRLLPAAGYALHHVAVLAHICQRVGQRRDLQQCGRSDPLAGAADRSGRVLSAEPARCLRTDQAHRIPARPDSRSGGRARRAGAGDGSDRRLGGGMNGFIIENMAPLMFAALVVFLLLGYPVAFSLGAIGLSFGILGVQLGLLHAELFQALPERLFGIMANDTLLAVPFFTFMGLILERSGMAEDLLNTVGQLFGPVR